MNRRIAKRIGLIVAAFGLMCLLGGCTIGATNERIVRGSGTVITESRIVSELDEVELTMSGDLTIEQGSTEALTIEGEDNIVPLISSDVSGRRLTLGTRENASFSNTKPLRFRLTVRHLSFISAAGSGGIQMDGVTGSRLQVKASGSGDITITRISETTFEAGSSGSGSINASGDVGDLNVRCSGSGDYKGRDLGSKTAHVELLGSGDATVKVSESLDATVSGSGSIRYVGSPEVNRHDSGSGEIEQLK